MVKIINKKGEAMVEASIVLPIIILSVISMIVLMIFYFNCLKCQIDIQYQLIDAANKNNVIFERLYKEKTVGEEMKGLSKIFMSKECTCNIYDINERKMILVGEFLYDN